YHGNLYIDEYFWIYRFQDTGVELRGDPITLWNGANLYFLGTNSRTAQSYHGNLYIDEYFWIYRFQELRKVASGMAMHKQWKQTYFSTPSTLNHDAYPFWDGQLFNRGRKKAQKVEIDISHQALAVGQTCDDGQWRQIVTVEDAVAAGCDLFDLEQLKLEYNEQEYNNLLMCQFVDDAASIFTLSELQACMVDSWTVWDDFYPLTSKPLSNRPVWIGYDPSRTRDDASCVVVSPPMVSGGKFRVLEKHSWNNLDFDSQANRIKSLTRQYNVQHIAIDTSGIGYGVYELVRKFFPATTKITYSVEVKNRLVLKAKQLISHRRLEFDSGWNDMALAFLTIHKTSTTSGKQVTYQASRTNETGHADLAWALMHALDREPLMSIDESGGGSRTVMEIF
ncbi:terminase large subunit domain-containing protein, partial [Veronia nyctiphanis]|uniref:terminase large subunit domain-containing protein n=1 Tax=Veronia nyctiphanis TaxID=1278244 RepID=UPI00191C3577